MVLIIETFPKMIELFCRSGFKLKNAEGLTPIHIDNAISSLSAIFLDDEYYKVRIDGKVVRNGLSVLRPKYIILFKEKAYMDLKIRKALEENTIPEILRNIAEKVLYYTLTTRFLEK